MDLARRTDADTWSADTVVLTADLAPEDAPTEQAPFSGIANWPDFKKQRRSRENDEALLIHLMN